MAYKLIAIDIDGTLLTDDRELPKRNIEAMHAAVKAGVEVMIATGRPYRAAAWVMEKAGIEGLVLSLGGALINAFPGEETVFASVLGADVVTELADCCRQNGWFWHCVSGSDYHYEVTCDMARFTELYFGYPGILMDFRADHGITFQKGNIVVSADITPKAAEKMKALIGDRAEVLISDKCVIDITPKGVNKAVSLLSTAERLGIGVEQIIAIGDTESDLSMIKAAGLGVCVANGTAAAKAAADYIAPSNNECGVAHVIEKFVLNAR